MWFAEMGDIQYLQPFFICDKSVTELNSNSRGSDEIWGADLCRDTGVQRIVQIDYDQTCVAKYVGINTGDGDTACAFECAVGVEGERSFEEVVARLTIKQ